MPFTSTALPPASKSAGKNDQKQMARFVCDAHGFAWACFPHGNANCFEPTWPLKAVAIPPKLLNSTKQPRWDSRSAVFVSSSLHVSDQPLRGSRLRNWLESGQLVISMCGGVPFDFLVRPESHVAQVVGFRQRAGIAEMGCWSACRFCRRSAIPDAAPARRAGRVWELQNL